MTGLMSFFVRNVVFPLQAIREGSDMPRLLDQFEKSQYLSPEDMKRLRLERLKKLLAHAYENCPFYSERFDKAGFDHRELRSFDDLMALPVLTKADIQNNQYKMRAVNLPDDTVVPDKTGGSTGRPLHYYLDKTRVSSRNAAALRHDRWTGWNIGDKSAYMWGHRQDVMGTVTFRSRVRNLLLDRRLVLDTSSITGQKLKAFKEDLIKFTPKIYVAYANSMYLYARYLEETGSRDHHRPMAIITSAELLAPEQRETIEAVFECKVFDRYGSRETSIIASECERHTGLHICAEALILEFLKDGRAVEPGRPGKIIITDLLNYGMPFIRYQIEDVGTPVEGECPCGRGLPRMNMAGGRTTDFLVTSDGKIISGASLTIYLIANAPGVAQAQLVQESRDRIVFRIVKDDKFGDESVRFFQREIPRFFGDGMRYDFEFVDEIPQESSGKYRFSISKIDPAEMF